MCAGRLLVTQTKNVFYSGRCLGPINRHWPVAGLIFNISSLYFHILCVYKNYTPSVGLYSISGQLEQYKCVVAMVMFHDITFYDRFLKAHFLRSDIPQTYALEVEYLRPYIR